VRWASPPGRAHGRAPQGGPAPADRCLTAARVLDRVGDVVPGAQPLRERVLQAEAALEPVVGLRAGSLGAPHPAVLEAARRLEQVLGDTARQEVPTASAAALRAVRPVLAWLSFAPQLADAAARVALAAYDDGPCPRTGRPLPVDRPTLARGPAAAAGRPWAPLDAPSRGVIGDRQGERGGSVVNPPHLCREMCLPGAAGGCGLVLWGYGRGWFFRAMDGAVRVRSTSCEAAVWWW